MDYGKLIELLNEYEPLNKGVHYEYNNGLFIMYDGSGREIGTSIEDEILISKKYGFVKWLVENNKININEEWDDYEETNLSCNSDFFQLQKHYSYYESLLMLLSIQDEPVKFLYEILK